MLSLATSGKSRAFFRPSPARQEGRFAIVTKRGAGDAVDATSAQDECACRGRRSRGVLIPRRWYQACGDRRRRRRQQARFSGYRMHTSLLRKLPETDSLLGVGFTEGGVMSMELGLGRFGDRRLEKGGPLYTRRWFDGLVRASDASQGTGHGRFGSRVFCATTG